YDGKNTINKNVVMALINRFALQEGTWRKYHKSGGDYIPYLKEVVRTGDILFKLYPNIAADYDKKFNSEDLSTYQGMILYKEYSQASMKHQIGGLERSSSSPYETHKAMVEMFLSQNGLPIKNASNTTYDGDKTMYDEFRNRDFRLLLNVTPPFKVTGAGSMNKWGFTKDPKDREYIDYMRANCRPFGKQLPLMNAAAPSYGSVVGNVPHFLGQDGQPFCVCRSGYYMWKHYNLEDNNPAANNSFDMPIFAIEEILLNYAEAKFELGEFGQDVADKTINKLRPRAKVAPMDVSLINNSFDPERDQTVDPVLWEIRRERITELFGEGFGFYDIRRWKRAEWFINRKQLGVYVHRTDLGGLKDAVKIDGGGKEGYVYLYSDPVKEMGKGWKDTYYLYPIPRQELTLNKKLIQNPGWDLE
ncbi:MAG: RagB/SusD family nutrient uptake outer membrane protein, partial [Rikenellaceae bacterium]